MTSDDENRIAEIREWLRNDDRDHSNVYEWMNFMSDKLAERDARIAELEAPLLTYCRHCESRAKYIVKADARIAKLEAALDWIGHQPAMEYATHIADKVCEMIGRGPLR